MERASGGGGGGGRGSTNKEDTDAKTYATLQGNTDHISMVVGQRNGNQYIQAGEITLAINETGTPGSYETTAYIDATHVNISGTNTVYALAGDLMHDANGKLIIKSAGGLYVQRTESGVTSQFGVFDNGNLTSGIIVQKINGTTQTTIRAEKIDMEGVVSALALVSSQVRIGTLSVFTSFDSSHIIDSSSGLFITGASFTFNHNLVSWQSTEVVTEVTKPSLSLTSTHTFEDINGAHTTGRLVSSWSNGSVTTATLNYLGKATS